MIASEQPVTDALPVQYGHQMPPTHAKRPGIGANTSVLDPPFPFRVLPRHFIQNTESGILRKKNCVSLHGWHSLLVARRNPVPEPEREIGRRLREYRLKMDLSQVAFARRLGIDANRLSSYEHGRVPLRFGVALRAADQFGINLEWLAEGIGDPSRYVRIGAEFRKEVTFNAIFRHVYSTLLKPEFEELGSCVLALSKDKPANVAWKDWVAKFGTDLGTTPVAYTEEILVNMVHEEVSRIPPFLRGDWFAEMMVAAGKYADAHRREIAAFAPLRTQKGKQTKSVDSLLKCEDSSGVAETVIPTQEELLARVVRCVKARGKQKELAGFVGVSEARVSSWVNRDRNPNGEATLRLLEWVLAEEDKQTRGRGNATNIDTAKTRKRNRNETNPKPGRRKP